SSAGFVSAGSFDEQASTSRAAAASKPARRMRLRKNTSTVTSRRCRRWERVELQLDIRPQRVIRTGLVERLLVSGARLVDLVQREQHVAAPVGKLDRMRRRNIVGKHAERLVIGLLVEQYACKPYARGCGEFRTARLVDHPAQ